ncbi:hypothetical protein K3495_g6452 [Podosphaera aphanis]|nr:hypothetical protein K3495_g6452 [Podosphaera aphanis]
MATTLDPMRQLLSDYAELNAAEIDVLHEAPSALEFMRYVALNRPFVIRAGAAAWPATRQWTKDTLAAKMNGQRVNVALTPTGYADAPRRDPATGELLFVKPWEELQDFRTFLDYIAHQETQMRDSPPNADHVRYAQTQNDNLRHEYARLFPDVESDIPWARLALQATPDAINLWIGNSRSTSALHKDNYENIYVQIIGEKHFVLLPPVAYACIAEQELTPASYVKSSTGDLVIQREDGEKIPFATWDPDQSQKKQPSPGYENLAIPVRVTLEKGDMLYLPSQWYHKVTQSCSEEGICCAVNYWYDMCFNGSFFSLCNFVRNVALTNGLKV